MHKRKTCVRKKYKTLNVYFFYIELLLKTAKLIVINNSFCVMSVNKSRRAVVYDERDTSPLLVYFTV